MTVLSFCKAYVSSLITSFYLYQVHSKPLASHEISDESKLNWAEPSVTRSLQRWAVVDLSTSPHNPSLCARNYRVWAAAAPWTEGFSLVTCWRVCLSELDPDRTSSLSRLRLQWQTRFDSETRPNVLNALLGIFFLSCYVLIKLIKK